MFTATPCILRRTGVPPARGGHGVRQAGQVAMQDEDDAQVVAVHLPELWELWRTRTGLLPVLRREHPDLARSTDRGR